MPFVLEVLLREGARWLFFFLPPARRIAMERRMRGRAEARKLRLADCVVVSYGKSGRTWLRVLISRFYQLKHGLPESNLIAFDNLHRKRREIPKIFFTHDNYLKDYTGHDGDKRDYRGKKVVLLVRHPADVAVSLFFQWKFRMRPHKKALNDYPPEGADTSVAEFVMDPVYGMPRIIEYLNLWAAALPERDDILVVRYEDLRRDTGTELRRIADFIGTPGSDEVIEGAVEFASFENMKQLEKGRVFWLAGSRMRPKDKNNPQSFKVRRGKVGGYRDYFSDDEAARIQDMVARELSPVFGYHEAPAAAVATAQMS